MTGLDFLVPDHRLPDYVIEANEWPAWPTTPQPTAERFDLLFPRSSQEER